MVTGQDRHTKQCEKCRKFSPLYRHLTDEEFDMLHHSSCSVDFRAGEVIIKQGTRAHNVVSFVRGFARLYREGHNGKDLIISFIKPWNILADPGVHDDGIHKFSVNAVADSSVCFIELERFREVMKRNHDLTDRYLAHISQVYGNALQRMVGLTQKQMHGRIADALLYLSKDVFQSDTFSGLITRQDIADYSAMSKDSAIRILKALEKDAVITIRGNTYRILRKDHLVKLSENG